MGTTKSSYENFEEYQNRVAKLADIRALGVEPYPHKYTPSHSAASLHAQFKEASATGHSEDAAAGKTPRANVAGRVVLFRAMGKNTFAQIQDDSDRIQVMFNRDQTQVVGYDPSKNTGPEPLSQMKFIEKKVDLGDIIGIEGHLFHTNKGELTLFADKVTFLCKTLLPLADKHSGLHDKELRYRKRWLDLISNADVRKTFQIRSQIVKLIRDYCHEAAFIEVETPVLQGIYGGAEARPFITKLNALDQEMFLRISLEIPLKKLVVGGMHRVFEIGRVFRNEGIDRSHNPEFTMIEAYAAYWDYNDMMQFVENLYERIAMTLFGTTKIVYTGTEDGQPVTVDVKAPWQRLTMKGSIKKYANLDVDKMSDEEIRKKLQSHENLDPKEFEKMPRGLLIAALFETEVEHHLIQPHHIIDHPIETTPLCKPHRNPEEKEKGIVERFESFILAQEICNAYTELNDPQLQQALLEKQANRREGGDEEASPYDEEFVEAICQGMPPTGGVGIGIDRLVMLFTNSHSIRDVLFFPWMKSSKAQSQ